MAIMASSTITLVGYLDAYGAAVEGGFEGSEEDFYNDLGLVEELPGLSYTVTTHTTTINNHGIAIEAIEEEFDETGRVGVAEQKITLIEAGEIKLWQGDETLADMLARMAQQISSLQGGGGNLLKNTNLGTYDDPSTTFWSGGINWNTHEARWPSWWAFEQSGLNWWQYERNLG